MGEVCRLQLLLMIFFSVAGVLSAFNLLCLLTKRSFYSANVADLRTLSSSLSCRLVLVRKGFDYPFILILSLSFCCSVMRPWPTVIPLCTMAPLLATKFDTEVIPY